MSSGKNRIRGFLTPKQRKYVEKEGIQCASDERRQWDYRIRESAKKALEDLAFLAENLPEDQQKEVFTVERVIPLIGAMLSFKVSKNAGPFQGMWEHRRRFYLAEQLRVLVIRMVDEFNKVFLGDVGVALTPFVAQWYEDSVIFSLGKKPFGEGAPIALFKPGEPIRYARAARSFKDGEEIPKDGLEFVTWEELGEKKPEPIRILRYKKAPGAPKMFVGDKAKEVWCTKFTERVYLGTCENCEYGSVEKCDFRELL